MKQKLILALWVIASTIFICSLPLGVNGQNTDPIKVKIDSVHFESKYTAIIYGKTLSGELVECAFGFSKNTGRELLTAKWITITAIPGKMKEGRKRAVIKLND